MSISVTCECGRRFEIPEVYAGLRLRCPDCGREQGLPEHASPSDVRFTPEEPQPTVTSGNAIASLALGSLFFFGCLSGVPAILFGRNALKDIAQSEGRLRGRGKAMAGIILGTISCFLTLALLAPAIRSSRETARRNDCANNLRILALSVNGYATRKNRLPPAAITGRDDRPLLSWRVSILQDLDSNTWSTEIQFDEPWDSPHNLRFLAKTPLSIYRCPGDDVRKPGTANYQVVVGLGTAFTPDFKPVRPSDITDGLDNTILIGESRRLVPWTKPEDLLYGTSPLHGIGSYHDGGFNVAFADGAVRFLRDSISPSILDALLTRNGNEARAPGSY